MRVESALTRKYGKMISSEGPAQFKNKGDGSIRRRTKWMTPESRIGLILAKGRGDRWAVQFAFESIDLVPLAQMSGKDKAPPDK